MKRMLTSILTLSALALASCTDDCQKAGYPISPVPFTSVKVGDAFWGQRLQASREVTVPLAFSKCEETGRYTNFVNAAAQMQADRNLGFKVGGYSFDDTDVFKTIEGASYLLQTYPDAKLEAYIDSVLEIVAAAQEPDGYLYTARTQNPEHPHNWAGPTRWSTVERLSHEFYNLGHMVEGAIAHYQATGKRNFLDIAIRYADCVCREIGDGEGQVVRVPGHQIAEMALAKLYTVTGDRKYLDQARFFLDKRGYTDRRDAYSQAHKPVLEQDEAVGHAVRAAYMYSGIADVAALTGDMAYIDAIDRIWENIVSKKMYITGGIGSTSSGEAFGRNYELPNGSAYCETCAAIGNVYVNYRMFLLHGESKYYDVLERTLYNGLISGVSLDGGSFFYPNPLASRGQHQRQPWFGCACCPSNICRFIPSVPGYVYAVKDNNLYVNLFMANEAEMAVKGKTVKIAQETEYPWDGHITLEVKENQAGRFSIKMRYPGWARNEVVPSDLYTYADGREIGSSVVVKAEGKLFSQSLTEDGYLTFDGKWKEGDRIEVYFDMQPRVVRANAQVKADTGRVAVERGPIVYCAEWPDNGFSVADVRFPANPDFKVLDRPDLLYGIRQIQTDVCLDSDPSQNACLTMIPYYAWCHRGSGEMEVWMRQEDTLRYEDHFTSERLRLDFVLAGNHERQEAFLQQLYCESQWAGSPKGLIDPFGYGDYCLKAYSQDGKLIFSKGFCTLFQEWRSTEEASRVSKAFNQTVWMPMPKDDIRIELCERVGETGQFRVLFACDIDPEDKLICRHQEVPYELESLMLNGDRAHKVDLVFAGEAYTADRMDKLRADAQRFMEYLFTFEPYRHRRDDFNVWLLKSASPEGNGVSIPHYDQWKRTVASSSFYTFYIDRYLTVPDHKKVADLFSSVPFDALFIIADETKYGGGGIFNSYSMGSADNERSNQVFIHEFGHGFAGLGDEYFDSEVAYEDYYPLDVEPWEPNLTTLVDFSAKWKDMIVEGTPVPTPNDSSLMNVPVGLFEGGGYMTRGVYRPRFECRMRNNTAPDFCPVCQRAIERMIDFYVN